MRPPLPRHTVALRLDVELGAASREQAEQRAAELAEAVAPIVARTVANHRVGGVRLLRLGR